MKIEVKRDKESVVALGRHLGIMKKLRKLNWLACSSMVTGLLLLGLSLKVFSGPISGMFFVAAVILFVIIPLLCSRSKRFLQAATDVFSDALVKIIDENNATVSDACIETGNNGLLISTNKINVSFPPEKIKKIIRENIQGKNFLFVYFANEILTIPENGLPAGTSLSEVDRIMRQNK